MTFTTPLLAAVVAAVAIPTLLILYFLKLRRKPMEVSTTLLWKKAIMDIQANAPFQKLRRNILLILQLIALAVLIAALAQPRTDRTAALGERVVIMLDRSASMAATDGDPGRDGLTRLEAAQRRAIEQVEALREPGLFSRTGAGTADQAMVIAFDQSAEIIQPFTADKRALVDAIRSVRPTDAPTSIEEAYALARAQRPRLLLTEEQADLLEDDPSVAPRMPTLVYHLFSDGRIPDADILMSETDELTAPEFVYHAVGDPGSHNIGIVALRAERAFDDPARLSVFVGIENTRPTERRVDVELLVEGTPASVRAVTVPGADPPSPGVTFGAPGAGGVVFELREPRGVEVRVRLAGLTGQPDNVLESDDEGILIVPPARRSSLGLVTGGNLFLTEALRGLPLGRFETISPQEYESLREQGGLGRFDVIVLDRYLPRAAEGERVLDPGRYMSFGVVPPPPQGVEDLGESGSGAIIDWRRNHPVLRSLTLDGVVLGRARPARIPDDSGVISLAETAEGPAIIEISDGTVRALSVLFDPGQSSWPFQVSFVVYLASAVEYLTTGAGQAGGIGSRQITPGGVLADFVPQGADRVRVVPPQGPALDLEPGPDGRVVYGPIRHRGIYRLEWSGPPGEADIAEGSRYTRFYAANLLDGHESDTRAAEELGLSDRIVQARRDEGRGLMELWPWAVLLALGIMMLEWWVYNRRVTL
ncbi:MAG: VWA domain-containing protein [Phycisphaerales bacterium]|nr:VWA domain-containing protein [Planctomycetota bacterium]MCH8510007.1 VWA domain-containing protein [Phycisphaerales bacterium]